MAIKRGLRGTVNRWSSIAAGSLPETRVPVTSCCGVCVAFKVAAIPKLGQPKRYCASSPNKDMLLRISREWPHRNTGFRSRNSP